jgi:hypothetical protein
VNLDGSFGASTPWADLADFLAGTNGPPVLTGSGPLTGGSPTNLLLTNALPGTSAYLFLGLSVLGAPFKGGVLVPSPDAILGPVPTGAGFIDLTFAWPTGLPSGVPLIWQYWLPDPGGVINFAASNGLSSTTP